MKIDREAIFDRQDGYCPWCDQHLGDNYAIHHRKLRKHGGTDSPENIIALHHGCHNLDTPSVHLSPAMGYDRGMIVHGWDDPIDVRLITKSGISELLLTDGTQQKENQNLYRGSSLKSEIRKMLILYLDKLLIVPRDINGK